ncbi:MAG: hypothetical protein CL610_19570 [Anaerolineaceae bacterium]|nr:hypothetical protein [Anaerolineaceae bacterium]
MTFKKIRFVTDSTCDIPEDVARKWEITVVPTYVNIGDGSYADDGVELDREDYFNRLPTLNPFPTTAAPSPGVARQKIDEAMSGADHVVIVTAPAGLSAIYESMRLGAAHLPPEQVTLIDGRTVTMWLGYQVLIGAEVAAETGDLAQVLAAVEQVREHGYFAAMINSLDNLRRSGRINLAAAGIGALLQVKPIVTIKDEVKVLSRVRTARRARDELVHMMRAHGPLERVSLLHVNNPEGIAWLREQVADILPQEVFEVNVSPTLGTHVGAQSLGYAIVQKNWRL